MLQHLLGFAVVAGLLTMLPGIDTAQVLRSAAIGGPRLAYATLAGIMAGVFAWGIAAALGISALLVASRTAYDVVRLAGAAYLLYLGLRIIVESRHAHARAAAASTERGARTLAPVFSKAFVITLTNPKNGLFYIAMLPQFLPEGVPAALGGTLLAAIHNLECLLWFSLLIWSTNLARQFFERPSVQTWMERISGTALVGFGVRVALER